ncbi:hypothetical protein CFAM422_008416 [Trichoderma lentiforme]|uniref:Uncharacterized protein n=1 Tax=Trichoderma lentiforme TaxID=1567552 RepID=A0A9P4XBT7_9HYPO|nr:hypothetical protein CFAM422_008416 [Trichoderma lentiforme]
MVKLSPGSHIFGLIANTLRNILDNNQDAYNQYSEPQEIFRTWITNGLLAIIQPLWVDERAERLQQIDKNAGCSFEWAFEDPSIGLKIWLQKGDGLY